MPRAESSGLALDQPFAQAAGAPQPSLEARHLTLILFVVVTKQMQQAVQCEDAQLGAERMPRAARLPAGDARGDDDVPEHPRLLRRKREDVSGLVFPAVLAIQSADAAVRHERDGDTAACTRRRD